MNIIKKCNCGAEYTETTWACLKCLGKSKPIDDGEKPDVLEYRDCRCGSTLAIWLDDNGQISAMQPGC